jgi:RimJ/RimL family protein N-acetyltransferase
LNFPAGETEEEFNAFYEKYINSPPGDCLYAIIDKAAGEQEEDPSAKYAGTIALTSTNPTNAVTEMGIMIFPLFQRTHVASNAIGLLLQYTLDPPSSGGLGLRRVEWKCHAGNEASRKAALRMGFELEGVLRWERAFPGGTVGLAVDALEKRNGSSGESLGRHTAVFSIVWDEWEEKRVRVVEQMERGRCAGQAAL